MTPANVQTDADHQSLLAFMADLPQQPGPKTIDWAVALPAIAGRSRGLIPIADVANYFGVTAVTVVKWILKGTHPSGRAAIIRQAGDKIGHCWHIHIDDLRAFEAAR